ncbi:PucR family transcriptional regulator [Rhodococcus maanshanensis]|uniref:PucR C-terminal helix-turn-helix domain-containing protein n=1 Tax=Rhodococcus maanshanensis TaxID=183556 RepID=A0A1H7YVL0_9NOCA|nr:helix-turn-helix domain-containing protein [Rhodococcus maanshanensis]SEM49189.1 PucR C-terminal helix-turn-helix domain-containing protein [Rhodococcus maanshanensis]
MSELGSDSVSVLRIISYFDELGESAANADTVVRSAALLAECPVGARWESGTVIRYGALGDPLDDDRPETPARQDLEVWLERAGGEHPLDSVLMDRLRHTLRVAAVRPGAAAGPRMGDPALLEVVLSGKERREDRIRAVGLLGLDPAQYVRVLAVSATANSAAAELISRSCPGRIVRSVAVGNLTAMLVQEDLDSRRLADGLHEAIVAAYPSVPGTGRDRGPWVGIGERTSIYAAPASWDQARRALRFASSTVFGRRAVAFGLLGSLELLAEIPLERLLNDRDVARLNAFAASEAGSQDVTTLEAFCVFGSLRRTATELHVHHSTVASRLAHIEKEMGWDLERSTDRFMATLALMLRRMSLSSAELAASEVFLHP